MTKRLTYIDITRAILIAMVVFGHILNYANPQYDIIPYTLAQEFMNSFQMPAFFILSGMLTDGEKWRSRSVGAYFVHKTRTLLVPYLFFECLAILYKHFVLRSVSLTEGLRLMLTMRCNVGADWFLSAMFLACALYYLYIHFPRKIAWGVGSTVLLLGLQLFVSAGRGHWRILVFRGILGFVFMLAGNLLKKPLSDFNWWKIGGAFLLTAAASAAFLKFSLDNSFYSGSLRSPLLYLISGICGTYFVMGIAKWIPWKWPAQIGENALTIMGTHQLVLYTIHGRSSLLWVIGAFLLIAAVEAVLILVINRFCPALVGKRRRETSDAGSKETNRA